MLSILQRQTSLRSDAYCTWLSCDGADAPNVLCWSLSVYISTHTCEAQHAIAQCLQVQRDYEELPEGAAESLRDSLLDLLLTHAASQPVRTQLCLAVAALVAHMPAAKWGPSGSLAWLVQHISKDGKEAAVPCLLDLLAILPQVSMILW